MACSANYVVCGDSVSPSLALLLPSPPEQTQRAEAGGEEMASMATLGSQLVDLNRRMICERRGKAPQLSPLWFFSAGTFALSPRHPRVVRIHSDECSCRLRVSLCQWPHGAFVQFSNRYASIVSAIDMSDERLLSSTGRRCCPDRHTAVFSSTGIESKFRAI